MRKRGVPFIVNFYKEISLSLNISFCFDWFVKMFEIIAKDFFINIFNFWKQTVLGHLRANQNSTADYFPPQEVVRGLPEVIRDFSPIESVT